MSSKIIIITTTVLLVASFSLLFVIEAKNQDYDYKKTWSVVYFENPRDTSLDFVVENHQGKKAEYKYEVSIGEKKMIDEAVEIKAGEEKKISPVLENSIEKNGQIEIVVEFNDAEYRIYKNI